MESLEINPRPKKKRRLADQESDEELSIIKPVKKQEGIAQFFSTGKATQGQPLDPDTAKKRGMKRVIKSRQVED